MSRILFVGHGSPATLIDEDQRSSSYHKDIKSVFADAVAAPPKAIVVLSAHWYSKGNTIEILGSPQPSLEYDFYGFDEELYEVEYPMDNELSVVTTIAGNLERSGFNVQLDFERGYDHGVWIPFAIAWDKAPCPVIQISLPWTDNVETYRRLGLSLSSLVKQNIWIVGSGDIVHNLGKVNLKERDGTPYEWATSFEDWTLRNLEDKNWSELSRWKSVQGGALSHPKPDHLYPAFVIAGAAEGAGHHLFKILHRSTRFLSISMTSFEYV